MSDYLTRKPADAADAASEPDEADPTPRYRHRPGDQPLPLYVHGVISSHQWVINYLRFEDLPNALHDAACTRINAREAVGIERYGQPLAPGNGRDVMRDVWEETVDQVAYLATAVREDPCGSTRRRLFNRAVELMLDVIAYMDGVPRTT